MFYVDPYKQPQTYLELYFQQDLALQQELKKNTTVVKKAAPPESDWDIAPVIRHTTPTRGTAQPTAKPRKKQRKKTRLERIVDRLDLAWHIVGYILCALYYGTGALVLIGLIASALD